MKSYLVLRYGQALSKSILPPIPFCFPPLLSLILKAQNAALSIASSLVKLLSDEIFIFDITKK